MTTKTRCSQIIQKTDDEDGLDEEQEEDKESKSENPADEVEGELLGENDGAVTSVGYNDGTYKEVDIHTPPRSKI